MKAFLLRWTPDGNLVSFNPQFIIVLHLFGQAEVMVIVLDENKPYSPNNILMRKRENAPSTVFSQMQIITVLFPTFFPSPSFVHRFTPF